jgi:hypothetical protein
MSAIPKGDVVRDVVRDVVHDVVVAVDGDVCLVYQLVYGSNFVVVPDLHLLRLPLYPLRLPALSARSPALTARSPASPFKFQLCVNGWTYTHDFRVCFLIVRVYTFTFLQTKSVMGGVGISHTTVSVFISVWNLLL